MYFQVLQAQSHSKKTNSKIIEGCRDQINGLWRFSLHDPSQGNQKSNIIAHNPKKQQNTSKHKNSF